MMFSIPVSDVIRRRWSCRVYQKRPLSAANQQALLACVESSRRGPLGSRARLTLMAASEGDGGVLKGLGTYGFIKNASGFLAGAVENGATALEDFGYLMELAVLQATDLGLGTCWLGGTFSKGKFAKKLELEPDELLAAVASVGYSADQCPAEERLLRRESSNRRLPAEALFFEGNLGKPLSWGGAGAFREALEMVRWAPSANNKQPWRVVHTGSGWHFFLQRSRGYGKGTLLFSLLGIADLQRVDIGIAMCHFELVIREAGLSGGWVVDAPEFFVPGPNVEYVASWRPGS